MIDAAAVDAMWGVEVVVLVAVTAVTGSPLLHDEERPSLGRLKEDARFRFSVLTWFVSTEASSIAADRLISLLASFPLLAVRPPARFFEASTAVPEDSAAPPINLSSRVLLPLILLLVLSTVSHVSSAVFSL